MIQKVLGNCLKPIIQAEAQLRNRYIVSVVLALGAVGMLGLILLAIYREWWSWTAVLGLLGVLTVGAAIAFMWSASRKPDLRSLAKRVEDEHPDLRAALLTAMDLKPGSDGKIGYLQSKVLGDVTEHAVKNRWVRQVSTKRLSRAAWAQFFSLVAFCVAVWFLLGQVPATNDTIVDNPVVDPKADPAPSDIEIAVTPGDVEVEKGNRLIVEATFSKRSPSLATLVLLEKDEAKTERGRIPMQVGLEDNVFSALVASVDADADYRIEYESSKSDEYSITTFEHPRLEKSDATITPPEYVKGEVRTIEDTRKVSLMEGSNLEWEVKVNKPVVAAELFGEDESVIALSPSKSDPTVLVAAHEPDETLKYRLHLVDDRDRANKRPPWFTVTVKRNLPPKLEFAFPKRDVEVSSIQELPVTATVWDDVEVVKAGVIFEYDGKEKNVVLSPEALKGGEHHPLETLFTLEDIGAEPRDLITYHLWAEDFDREGKVRRSASDMFFAEVRHFEDIFREQETPGGEGAARGGQAEKLLKLQKDVLNATWKLIRRKDMGRTAEDLIEDVDVVRQSQIIALSQTAEAAKEIEDPELKVFFEDAGKAMEKAIQNFEVVLNAKDLGALQPAYNDAREAYEKLIQARAREHNITQSQQPSQGQPQEQEQKLMNLELKQKELKYQENTQAQQEQTAQQQENLEVLNRLKELARRQEAIAEKIKELEDALNKAKNEEEKDEIKRQLKRLQEEQEQLLRELDDLGEKMDSEENRADMSEAREQLEDIREDVREASEKLNEEKLADAANAATRAQRELEEATEEFRKKTSRQFSEEMKSLRSNARELAEAQEEITKQLEADSQKNRADPFSQPSREENKKMAQTLEQQEERLENLIEEMKTLSEESEVSEPLLSDALYDAVRNTMVNGVDESLKEATRFMRYNRRDQAQQPAEAAARGIEELRAGVEEAAERILGSESDALRLARSELDDLIEQALEEEQRLGGKENGERESGEKGEGEMELASNERATGNRPGEDPGEGREPGTQEGQNGEPTGSDRLGEGEQGEQPGGEKGKGGKEKGQTPGNGQEPGDEPGGGEKGKGQGEGEQPGEQGMKGKGKGKGEGEGQGEQSGSKGKGKGPGKGKGEGGPAGQEGEGQKGKGKGKGEGQGQEGEGDSPGSSSSQQRMAGPNMGGDDRGGGMPTGGAAKGKRPLFFNQEPKRERGPITGEDYKEFADRLGNLEEMLEEDDLRNEVAKVLDEARSMRIDFKRDNLPPGAPTIRQKITDPLVELRNRISEELAKLNKENPLSPIDRDPVPGEFRDLVRRYYEELGSGR